ncbi:MAG: (d)CMP kinase [Patescibacteria group bacterium]|jgi:cytidylate kinase
MIITISGAIGSGKSSVSRALAKQLKYRQLDVGHLRRAEATKRGLTLHAFNAWAEAHPDAGDRAFDKALVKEARKYPNLVLSSRTAFHFFPRAFNVFLDVAPREGARRVLADQKNRKNEVGELPTLTQIMKINKQRVKSDTRRYKRLYGVNVFLRKQYSFVLDTTKIPLRQVISKVKKAYREWEGSRSEIVYVKNS